MTLRIFPKIYSAFIIEYRKSMGEDYTQTIEDFCFWKELINHLFLYQHDTSF